MERRFFMRIFNEKNADKLIFTKELKARTVKLIPLPKKYGIFIYSFNIMFWSEIVRIKIGGLNEENNPLLYSIIYDIYSNGSIC